MNKNVRTLNFTGREEDEMTFVREKDLVLRILMEKLTDKQIVELCEIIGKVLFKKNREEYIDTIKYLNGVAMSYALSHPHRLSYQQRFFACKTLAKDTGFLGYCFLADYIKYEVATEKIIIYYKGQFQEIEKRVCVDKFKEILRICTGISINLGVGVELILHKNTYEEVFRNYK